MGRLRPKPIPRPFGTATTVILAITDMAAGAATTATVTTAAGAAITDIPDMDITMANVTPKLNPRLTPKPRLTLITSIVITTAIPTPTATPATPTPMLAPTATTILPIPMPILEALSTSSSVTPRLNLRLKLIPTTTTDGEDGEVTTDIHVMPATATGVVIGGNPP